MAWTDKTWAFQEGVESAEMNQLRDNFRLVGPHLIARKTADEPITSNTTPQNDDHLLMSVAANEVWHTEWNLQFTTPSAATGLRVQWSFPASGDLRGSWIFSTAGGAYGNFGVLSGTNPTTAQVMGANSIGSDVNNLKITLIYVGGANAGTLQLLWAQGASNGTATVMKAHSTLWAVQLA